jgi:hypothetical protein
MADLTLGNKPLDIEVLLYAGYDFVDGIGRDDGTPWPEGSSLTLVLPSRTGDTEWPATFDTESVMVDGEARWFARWDVDQTDVDAAIATKPTGAKLRFVNGGSKLLWGQGKVKIG